MTSTIRRIGFAVFLSVFGIIATKAQDATMWEIDKSQSAVNFSINNFFVSVKGQFTEFDGDIYFDSNNLKGSHAKFIVSTESIDTDNSTRDSHLKVENFFDVENYPEMIFKSSKFEKKSETEFLIYGKLTIKETSKDVILPMKITNTSEGGTQMDVEIETTIDRKDYGVGTGFWSVTVSIGNEVRIDIPLKLKRKN